MVHKPQTFFWSQWLRSGVNAWNLIFLLGLIVMFDNWKIWFLFICDDALQRPNFTNILIFVRNGTFFSVTSSEKVILKPSLRVLFMSRMWNALWTMNRMNNPIRRYFSFFQSFSQSFSISNETSEFVQWLFAKSYIFSYILTS